MNKTSFRGHGLKRVLAALLCALMLIGILPTGAFAATAGQSASSWFGDNYVSIDGSGYHHPASWSYIRYYSNGTTGYGTTGYSTPYRHYMLTDSSGATHSVYCIESGVDFGSSTNAYVSDSGTNSAYFSLLPGTAQRGIQLATIYGWQPGASVPISGINADDWKIATQMIIWEYQQQLRSDPHSRHNNNIIAADQFYNVIKGRPAERAYQWILDQIAAHSTVPSFASTNAGSAPVHELKWDAAAKVYRLTLTDTNNLNIDLQALNSSGITVTRSGNQYTFTSQNMIENPVTLSYRKNIPVAEDMLIWGRTGYQTMMTGASDPVSFFVRIKTETYGTASVVKTSEDGIVEGISFRIVGNGVDKTVKTGANGKIDTLLLPGRYQITEMPVDRYVTPAAQYVTIESGQTSTVHFSNILKKFRVELSKTDVDTGNAQGDATLGGAVYGLYKDGELVDTYTTAPDGSFITRYYVCGDGWTVREITPSTGYLLDETVHEVGASPKLYEIELNTAALDVTEKAIYGKIQLIKHTDDPDPDVADEEHSDASNAGMVEKPEEGAVFEVYLAKAGSYATAKESERDLLTTDSDGFAVTKDLPYGRYTVHQTAGEEGKAFVPDFTVFICKNEQTYSYILNNDTITARIRVEKQDAETGKIVPMSGTGYKIKDLATGEFISQTVFYPTPITLDVFYTSDEGWLMLPDPLAYGDYKLYEVQAPFGYVLSNEPVSFTVDGADTTVTVVQKDMPQKGQITISKTGEVFYSVEENEGLYQPVYKVRGLPGAEYDVIADEDIYTGDGTLRAAKDMVVDTLITGDDATATSDLLYLGHYRLEERKAPVGMVVNTEPVYVELSYAGQEVEVVQTSLALYDERQKVEISLNKGLETDETFGIGFGDEYKDISFSLYAAYDLEALDGSVIPADGLLEVISLTPDGEGCYTGLFASDLPFGSYYAKETATNSAYILTDGKEYPAVFGYAGQEIGKVTVNLNDGEMIPNEILRGDVEGVKYGENPNGGDKVTLAGAVMGLFAPDAEEFTLETALLTAETAEDGSFAFHGIPYGHWIVAEISAPALYTVSPEQHHVYIGVDGQKIEIAVDNTLIRGKVQLTKTEEVDEPSAVKPEDDDYFLRRLTGAVFELYEDSNANKEFDEGDKLLRELEETESGFYEADRLMAKGYFVKEKTAPAGYEIDEKAYYFAISEDGQIVVIENGEAGRGFTNEAYRGNLKIVKDSSDGRKDGFAFEVKNADGSYCEVFTSDKSGVIEVKGLRVGVYTVREIANKASEDYIIPDGATVEIKADQTATVQFFNEKPTPEKPTTPTTPTKPVPQTGDDFNLYLWLGLLGLGVIGAALSGILFLRCGKKGGKRRGMWTAVFLICIALSVGSGYMLAKQAGEYKAGADAYSALSSAVEMPQDDSDPYSIAGTQEAEGVTPSVLLPTVDFAALQAAGSDVAAWLTLPDTAINYPVAQASDNSYYLKHLPDGTWNRCGCLFIDYENADGFTDKNTVIYGHNMRDGSMFSTLTDYAEQSYYGDHTRFLLVTPEGGYAAEVFSAFVASPNESGGDTSPWRLEWKDDGAFTTWLTAMRSRSLVETDVSVTSGDKVLTLSTCTNNGRDRFIVMCKLVAVNE